MRLALLAHHQSTTHLGHSLPRTLFTERDVPKELGHLLGARRATIVIHTEELISAVEVLKNGVNVFTLLPNLGLGVSYNHTYTTMLGKWFETTTFTAKCNFAK